MAATVEEEVVEGKREQLMGEELAEGENEDEEKEIGQSTCFF